ncbi:MAG: ATP-binding protein [Bryobacteraceae bacterium]
MPQRLYRATYWIAALALIIGPLLWFLIRPAPLPKFDRPLRLGMSGSKPFQFWKGDSPAGFTVEAFDEAARRAGVPIEWNREPARANSGLLDGSADLWARVPDTPRYHNPKIHLTRPWMTFHLVLLSPAGPGAEGPVRSVAVAKTSDAIGELRRVLPEVQLYPVATREGAMEATCTGKADAVLLELRVAQQFMLDRPAPCQGVALVFRQSAEISVPCLIGSTLAAAPAAEALRDQLDHMAADGTLAGIQAKWFLVPQSDLQKLYDTESARRTQRLLLGGMLALIALSGVLVWQTRRLRAARLAAERANAAKSEFLAAMSHEIRTPMNGVLSMADLLRATPLSSSQKEMADIIYSSSGQLLHVLNDILDFSKVEAGEISLEDSDVAVRAICSETLRLFGESARSKGIELALSFEKAPPTIIADATRLRQILLNLTGNAIKFTSHGRVELRVSSTAGNIRFEVIDTGIGMRPEQIDRVFQPFAQAHGDAHRYGGTGLGLAISRKLVHRMGGEMGVISLPGQGSTFWFWLPLRQPTGPAEQDDPDAITATGERKFRILVCEDNIMNAKVVLAMLARIGHSSTCVYNGEEAIAKAAGSDFDLVLMDCQMPKLDGYEATRRIRAREASMGAGRLPIVAMTAHALTGDREKCLAAGMDEYVTKPLNLRSLKHAIERALAQSQSA